MTSVPLRLRARKRGAVRVLNVELYESKDEDTCPISQSPIHELELDFVPLGSTFLPDHPELTAMRLPCTHQFNSMHLLYHFVRNNTTLCPVCRSGPAGARLINDSIPKHVRRFMLRRAKAEQKKDVEEQVRQDLNVAMQTSRQEHAIPVFQVISAEVSLGIPATAVEVRYEDGSPSVMLPMLAGHVDADRFVFVCSNQPNRIDRTKPFRLLGSVAGHTAIWFPSSLVVGPEVLHGSHNFSTPRSVSHYIVIAVDDAITCVVWTLPADFFYMSLQWGSLRRE